MAMMAQTRMWMKESLEIRKPFYRRKTRSLMEDQEY